MNSLIERGGNLPVFLPRLAQAEYCYWSNTSDHSMRTPRTPPITSMTCRPPAIWRFWSPASRALFWIRQGRGAASRSTIKVPSCTTEYGLMMPGNLDNPIKASWRLLYIYDPLLLSWSIVSRQASTTHLLIPISHARCIILTTKCPYRQL